MAEHYNFLSLEKAAEALKEIYGLEGQLQKLPGEADANFKVVTPNGNYLLKISEGEVDTNIEAQLLMLQHLSNTSVADRVSKIIPTLRKEVSQTFSSEEGGINNVRLYNWIEGPLWSSIPQHDPRLLYSLGQRAGELTKALQDFSSPLAHRSFDWDISNTQWTLPHQHLFSGLQRKWILQFYQQFQENKPLLEQCRKSVIHNDANDNNLVLEQREEQYEVKAIIDFGDAVYTATINDLAVCITYAVMGKVDPLEAAVEVIRGYHSQFPLLEVELDLLFSLVGARLVISLTKSALNKRLHPENSYLTISEKPAWELLEKWQAIHPDLAAAFFRKACGFAAHPEYPRFLSHFSENKLSLKSLLGRSAEIENPNLDLGSAVVPKLSTYKDPGKLKSRILELYQDKKFLPAGGYNEVRADFINENTRVSTNAGSFWRSTLLSTQFWFPADQALHSFLEGKVIFAEGQRVIMEYQYSNSTFYAIYQNLEPEPVLSAGANLPQGAVLGRYISSSPEAFSLQLALYNPLDLPAPSSCIFEEAAVYRELFPSPEAVFEEFAPSSPAPDSDGLINFRKEHLGRSMSLSYVQPLQILRGDGLYLIDHTGRKYMDLVNNVAHVGHEHPEVVRAGQEQMAMLNTNSRYLHPNIVTLAENLLQTFPKELSVVHFVNSGSEANELAIRMAKAATGAKDFISVEMGYHGNTNACIAVSPYKFDGKGGQGAPETTQVVPLPDSFRGQFTGPDTASQYSEGVKEKLEIIKTKGRKPAAFIAESIISCAGQVELPEGYLADAYSQVRAAGGLCIADEVQVGCGRIGKHFWGFQLHGVIPDIVTIGKPLGNGHPLAAVVCTAEVAEAFANGMEYFNTFGGNPVSCAIGNKVLEVIRKENLQQNALETGEYLMHQLRELSQRFPIIADVRGQGLFLGFELCNHEKKPLGKQASVLVQKMKERGFLMSTEGRDDNVLKIKPPMVFAKDNANEFLDNLIFVLNHDFFKI